MTFSNGLPGTVHLSICIPTFRHPPCALIDRLATMGGAQACALIVYDDGSRDGALTDALKNSVRRYPGPAQLITAAANAGRSHARNRLVDAAHTDWVLFLDADMLPDNADFLARYLDEVTTLASPAIVAGGFSLQQAHIVQDTQLHAAQSLASECLPAATRATEPGRYVFTSNILTHKQVLQSLPFDAGFVGWGWEDVDWGLRAAHQFTIRHIDNPATHLGLDSDAVLIGKYASSGQNFAHLVSRNAEVMSRTPLYRMARLLKKMPGRPLLQCVSRALAGMQRLPVRWRLFALKLFRAAVYAGHLD